MHVAKVVRKRLEVMGLSQQELASALKVTESYVSQLLTGKKAPPAPERTDLYERLDALLRLPPGQLARLADGQRREALKRKVADPPAPLYGEVRQIILEKCKPGKAASLRDIFETQPFGELERLVTQKLLDVAKKVAREELASEEWLKTVARLSGRKNEEMRVAILEFLDTDVFSISPNQCVSFLDPLIETWDIDLGNFGMEIVLNRRLAAGARLRLEFVERDGSGDAVEEPGLTDFLRDRTLSGDATAPEIEFLKQLRFNGQRPTALYYYRELQSFRDPLHFIGAGHPATAPMQKHRDARGLAREFALETRKAALGRWRASTTAGRKPARPRAARKARKKA